MPPLAACMVPEYCLAQGANTEIRDLSSATLEQLLKVEITTAGRKDQRLFGSAAAAFVITRDAIRRSGLTSIPEVLRMAPGLHVARVNSNQWAVTARGFNGRFANKMLVLVDGRTVFNNLYAGVYWDMVDVFLDDVERIEVIRGPGATLWGPNAVNGVINIITRSAKETHGWLASYGSGSEDYANAAVRYGGSWRGNLHYRAFSKFFSRGDTSQGVLGNTGDSWNSLRGGMRVDWDASERDSVNISGDMFQQGAKQLINPSFPSAGSGASILDPLDASGGFLLGRWKRVLSEKSEFTLQTYYDHNRRTELFGRGNFSVFDLDFQHRYRWSTRNDLISGLGLRRNWDELQGYEGRSRYIPGTFAGNMYSGFVQNDTAIVPDKLTLTLGARLINIYYTGWEVQPTARLSWTPTRSRTLWGSISRAVHTPSRFDRSLQLDFPIASSGALPVIGRISGTPAFGSEGVISYEAGFRQEFGNLVIADIAGFVSDYDSLKQTVQGRPSLETGPQPRVIMPFLWTNTGVATTRGFEIATTWNLHSKWKMTGNYSYFSIAGTGRSYLPDAPTTSDTAPRHQLYSRSSVTLPHRLSWDASLQYVSRLGSGVPAYARVDSRLAASVGETGEWSIGFYNLLDPAHNEYLPEAYLKKTLIRRSLYMRWVWGR